MDMDENYDDSGDDDKKSTKQESRRNSPRPAAGGLNGTAPTSVSNHSAVASSVTAE